MSSPCVVPVAAADAVAWAEGRLNDRDLLLRTSLAPEAVFIVDLPDLYAYREMLQRVAFWKRLGAVCMVCRTGTPLVDRHVRRFGGLATLRELTNPVKERFFLPPEGFSRWTSAFCRNPANGKTPAV